MSPRPISILHREADPDLVAYCERLLERSSGHRRARGRGRVAGRRVPDLAPRRFAVLPMVGELELVQHRLLTDLNARLEEH